MADPRFFSHRGPLTLARLAELSGARMSGGQPERKVRDVAPLAGAGPDEVTFLDHAKYVEQTRATRPAACLIRPALASVLPAGVAALITERPQRAYARVAAAFYPDETAPGAVRVPSGDLDPDGAVVHPSARLGEACRLAAGAVIEAGAELGPGCEIAANAVIGRGVVLGADCIVGPTASLSHCLLGDRVVVHAGARIGQEGFGFALDERDHVKVPQLGRVLIEDDVEIGANTTIDRGSGPDTVIGRGCKIDNLVMIAHNVRLGPGCIVVAQSGISGSTRIGAGSVLAAQVGIVGHLVIGAGVRLAARSAVTRDLPGGRTYGGAPALPIREWRRQVAGLRRLVKRRDDEA